MLKISQWWVVNKSQPWYFIHNPMSQEEIETLDNLSLFICDQIKWQHTSLLSHRYLPNIPAVLALPRPVQFRESIGKLRTMAQIQKLEGILKIHTKFISSSVLRIRDVYPGRILNFVHPGYRIQQQQQKRGEQICCHTFLCILCIENYFIFEQFKKKTSAYWLITKT